MYLQKTYQLQNHNVYVTTSYFLKKCLYLIVATLKNSFFFILTIIRHKQWPNFSLSFMLLINFSVSNKYNLIKNCITMTCSRQ